MCYLSVANLNANNRLRKIFFCFSQMFIDDLPLNLRKEV